VPQAQIAILLVLVSGVLLSIQAPLNATLSRAVGSPVNGALIAFIIGTLALSVLAFVLRTEPDMAATRGMPWWGWCGGLCGAVFVTVAAFAAPRIGVAALLTLGVASQLAMAVIIDHFGMLGVARQAISSGRVLGIALVVAGAILVRRS